MVFYYWRWAGLKENMFWSKLFTAAEILPSPLHGIRAWPLFIRVPSENPFRAFRGFPLGLKICKAVLALQSSLMFRYQASCQFARWAERVASAYARSEFRTLVSRTCR